MSEATNRLREAIKSSIQDKRDEADRLHYEADGLQQALSMLIAIESDEFRKERVSP